MRIEKPFVHCCAEAGGDVERCDCVNKDHGTAWFSVRTPSLRQAGGRCTASPDHADILETIENAADDWQKNGYTSALAEVRDMANVGRALMEALPEGYSYLNCPSEIVSDLQNERDDALALRQAEAAPGVVEALQLAHDTLHECTAVLTANDCGKVAGVMKRCREALARQHGAQEDAAPPFSDAAMVEAKRAGEIVLKGQGDGTYAEAEDAIRLLTAAIDIASRQPAVVPDHWPTADQLEASGKAPWQGEQPIQQHAKMRRGRLWVPLEAAESALQFWQRRDYEKELAIRACELNASRQHAGVEK